MLLEKYERFSNFPSPNVVVTLMPKGTERHFNRNDKFDKYEHLIIDAEYDPEMIYRLVRIGTMPDRNFVIAGKRGAYKPSQLQKAVLKYGPDEFNKNGEFGTILKVTDKRYKGGEYPAIVVYALPNVPEAGFFKGMVVVSKD